MKQVFDSAFEAIDTIISIKPIGDFWIFFTKPFEIRHGRRRPYREFFEKMGSWSGARTRDLPYG